MESGSFKWVCDKAAGIGIAANDSNGRSAAGIESDSEAEGEVESDSKPEPASDPPSKEAHSQVQVTATLFS